MGDYRAQSILGKTGSPPRAGANGPLQSVRNESACRTGQTPTQNERSGKNNPETWHFAGHPGCTTCDDTDKGAQNTGAPRMRPSFDIPTAAPSLQVKNMS